MLARWYLLLGQFSVTFEYSPGAQHTNADGMSRQCGQCQRPDCPVSATESPVMDTDPETEMVDQPFASSEIHVGESMDADLLPAGSNVDLITAPRQDTTLATVRGWIQSESTPTWAECAGFSPELHCWRLQVGNLSIGTDGRLWRRRAPPAEGSQLVVPRSEQQAMIRRFHDSLFAGHLGISRTVFRLQTRVYWPGCSDICRLVHSVHSKKIPVPAKGSYGPCCRRPPLGESLHGLIGHVNHVGKGKSLCVSDGGLLLSMIGGLSASR